MPTTRTTWKVLELLNWTTNFLKEKGFANPRLNAELLLTNTLKCDRVGLYLDFDKPLGPVELSQFKIQLQRRLKHEPLQYILGKTEFMSLPFYVTPAVLIPRPETELLVEYAIIEIGKRFPEPEPISCLDIGTGSGNIAISLARNLPVVQVTAIDISKNGLDVAKQNAQLNRCTSQVHFLEVDIHSGDFTTKITSKFNVVVANPPYIASRELPNLPLEIRNYEPIIALDGGADGLYFYNAISRWLANLLTEDGFALFEIGCQQGKFVKTLFNNAGYPGTTIIQDLASKDRIVLIKK